MPCGGIFPVKGSWVEYYSIHDLPHRCIYCDEIGGVTHFCEEWDGFLHAQCIDQFLMTEEGKIVVEHGHEIVR